MEQKDRNWWECMRRVQQYVVIVIVTVAVQKSNTCPILSYP